MLKVLGCLSSRTDRPTGLEELSKPVFLHQWQLLIPEYAIFGINNAEAGKKQEIWDSANNVSSWQMYRRIRNGRRLRVAGTADMHDQIGAGWRFLLLSLTRT
jgi:hypothetical protein